MRAARWVIRAIGVGLIASAAWFAFAPVHSIVTGNAAARFPALPRSCVPLRDMLAAGHQGRSFVCGDAIGTHLAWSTVLVFAALVVLVAGDQVVRLVVSASHAAHRVIVEEDTAARDWAEYQAHGDHPAEPH
jgi:hypothetical protein